MEDGTSSFSGAQLEQKFPANLRFSLEIPHLGHIFSIGPIAPLQGFILFSRIKIPRMEADEARAQSNSEMRFIALELMKLSFRRKVPFSRIARRFVKNVYFLERLIRAPSAKKSRPAARLGAKMRR
jgi:hypothetical protein